MCEPMLAALKVQELFMVALLFIKNMRYFKFPHFLLYLLQRRDLGRMAWRSRKKVNDEFGYLFALKRFVGFLFILRSFWKFEYLFWWIPFPVNCELEPRSTVQYCTDIWLISVSRVNDCLLFMTTYIYPAQSNKSVHTDQTYITDITKKVNDEFWLFVCFKNVKFTFSFLKLQKIWKF